MSRDYVAIARQYADDVLSGAVVAGEYIRAACQRYLSDLHRSDTDPGFDYRLSADRAAHACRFIECMPHTKGQHARAVNGRVPTLVMEPWQVFATVNLFGWVDADGIRRFVYCYIEVAKKNGKSTWLSGVCLYMATADGEPGAEVYTAATNYDQAKIVWSDCAAMLKKLPALAARFGAHQTIYDIKFAANNAVLKPLATDKGGSKDGLNVHCAAIDEVHAHKDSLTYDIVASGIAARQQPLVIAITTAGTDTTGVAYRERTIVTKILTGQAEHDRYFGLVYCLDSGDDWRNEANWIKANPSLGVTIPIDYLRDKAAKVALSPTSESEFRQKSLNEWVGVRNGWISITEQWEPLADPALRESDFVGCPRVGGLDLASRNDLAGWVSLYARQEPGQDRVHWYAFCHQYINEKSAETAAQRLAQQAANRARESGNAHYPAWASAGWLTVTPGNTTDQDQIERDLIESNRDSPFNELGFDNFNAAMMAGHLLDDGVQMVDVPMRVNPLSPAMRWLESLIADGRLHHDGNPVLSWCLGNVTVKPDANDNIFPRKDAPELKIDAAVGLIVAAARAMLFDSAEVFDLQSQTADAQMAEYLADVVSLRF